jgi:PhoU domain
MELAMSAHTRTVFNTDLSDLAQMVAEMGGLAEQQIARALEALAKRNSGLARQVIDRDETLDAFQISIAGWLDSNLYDGATLADLFRPGKPVQARERSPEVKRTFGDSNVRDITEFE